MKTFITTFIFFISIQSIAGTVINRKTDEKITVNCIETTAAGQCSKHEAIFDMEYGREVKEINYGAYYQSRRNDEIFQGTIVGVAGPVVVAAFSDSGPLLIAGAFAITPVTAVIGLAHDVVLSPIKVTRAIRTKKIKKALKNLFNKKEYSKMLNNRNFKEVLNSIRY